jgi:hypothetical protein
MGEQPTWHRVLRAAQFLRVAPWELAAQPLFWLEAAESAQAADAHAEKMNAKKPSTGAT